MLQARLVEGARAAEGRGAGTSGEVGRPRGQRKQERGSRRGGRGGGRGPCRGPGEGGRPQRRGLRVACRGVTRKLRLVLRTPGLLRALRQAASEWVSTSGDAEEVEAPGAATEGERVLVVWEESGL